MKKFTSFKFYYNPNNLLDDFKSKRGQDRWQKKQKQKQNNKRTHWVHTHSGNGALHWGIGPDHLAYTQREVICLPLGDSSSTSEVEV